MAGTGESLKERFEAITLPHLDRLYRLAYSRVGNRADAEDLVQETYLKAYRAFAGLKKEGDPQSWLSQILINNLRDHFRKSTRRPPLVDLSEDLTEQIAVESWTPGPEERICETEGDPELKAVLNTMPEKLVMPLLLRHISDLSYEDIASVLGIPIGTVMSRLSRARDYVRRRLTHRKTDSRNVS
ncbi:MAG: sigma-70 family RNA polymerase sigma factor [Cyanobacteria bacterium HKST-UBA02]|nr:sigma-70 family RNA polymerase sigma factor [Cyanobacteria bacterium HKST-UBA02]